MYKYIYIYTYVYIDSVYKVLLSHFFLPKLLYVEEGPRNCFIVTWFNSVNTVNYLFHFERIGDFRGHSKKKHI